MGGEVVAEVEASQRPLTVGLIHGSWFGPESLEPLCHVLREDGHYPVVVDNLPTLDPNATAADFVTAAVERLREERCPYDVLLFWSNAGLLMQKVVEGVGDLNIGHVLALSPSFGVPSPKDYGPDVLNAVPRHRNTSRFRGAIETLPDETTILNPAKARWLMLNGAPRWLANLAVKWMMKPQYRFTNEPPLHTPLRVKSTLLQPEKDRVRNHRWAKIVAKILNMRFKETCGGHAMPITHPHELRDEIVAAAPRIPDGPTIPLGQRRPPLQRSALASYFEQGLPSVN